MYRKALLKADEIRRKLKLNMFQPVNIFDACIDLGLTVRFVEINMEGMYVSSENGTFPTILLSNQRPLPRRIFTCAHELGHHFFEHGTRVDALSDQTNSLPSNNNEESLVNAFAGALLMPIAGIQSEFVKRGWKPQTISPVQLYTICSVFGTGYQTLIVHCQANKIFDEAKGNSLLKYTPAKILKNILGTIDNNSHFKIIDSQTDLSVIDIEVSNFIILPTNFRLEGSHLQKYQETLNGSVYIAVKPGIIRVAALDNSVSYFIRIQNANYIGLAENRHLENEIN